MGKGYATRKQACSGGVLAKSGFGDGMKEWNRHRRFCGRRAIGRGGRKRGRGEGKGHTGGRKGAQWANIRMAVCNCPMLR